MASGKPQTIDMTPRGATYARTVAFPVGRDAENGSRMWKFVSQALPNPAWWDCSPRHSWASRARQTALAFFVKTTRFFAFSSIKNGRKDNRQNWQDENKTTAHLVNSVYICMVNRGFEVFLHACSLLFLKQFCVGKKQSDFSGGCGWAVRTMHQIILRNGRVIATNGAR
jgi:hypothetical protein